MKKLICLAFILPFLGQAQIPDYFANQPTWRVYSSCAVAFPCLLNEDMEYFLGPDTLIAGTLYHKIFKRVDGSFWYQSPGPAPPGCSGSYSYVNDTAAAALLRQDGRRMMIWVASLQAEELLHDFDLAVGDTIPPSHINIFGTADTVVSVDSIFIRGQYRRVMHTGEGLELIEGVGSNRGLIEPIDLIFDCGYSRTCFSLQDTSWLPLQGANCALILGSGHRKPMPKIGVRQEREGKGFWVDLSEDSESMKYSVCELSGKLIFCGILSPGSNHLANDRELCNGVYFLHVSSEGFSACMKVLVNR